LLITRLFDPADGDILYHYCSAPTFQQILDSGKIRFSDINMLNDPEEMHWGYSVFEEAAGKLIEIAQKRSDLCELNKDFFDKVDDIIAPLQTKFHPFVSCFSRDGDLSAQWYAYADSARGFSIGFAARALKHMPISMLAVEYEREKQVQEMMDALGASFMENQADGNKFGQKFRQSCIMIGTYMTAFKNPKYREEKEVRCLHVVNPQRTKNAARLIDQGGMLGGDKSVHGEEVRFRVQDNSLIAFIDMPFRRGFENSAIKRILLGSKNYNWPGNVFYFTGSLGYEDVIVGKSSKA
jgi:hypothetical protein